MTFPCTRCGACCAVASPLLGALGLVPLNAAGFCTHLCGSINHETRCMIYETRPALCNLQRVHAFLGTDEATFVRATAAGCNELQERLDIDPSFRVVLEPQ